MSSTPGGYYFIVDKEALGYYGDEDGYESFTMAEQAWTAVVDYDDAARLTVIKGVELKVTRQAVRLIDAD